jgi:DNA-binding response OmpR family regulator
MQALLLAEEERLAARIGLALRIRWPEVKLAVVDSALQGRRILANDPPDLVFVSAALSDTDPLALIREIRAASDIVLFLVGSGGEDEDVVVEALEAGADDYLHDPSRESLLVARVAAALRRAKGMTVEEQPARRWGDLAIDPKSHEVRLKGKPLYLTPTEFKLLYHLAQQKGRVVTQQALESVVWGCSDKLYVDVLRKHVQRLRRKLESRRGIRTTITTIPRVGYKLAHKHAAPSSR